MIAFTVLLMAAAASATAIPSIEKVQETGHIVPEQMRLLNIFSVPKFNRDFLLPHEKLGVKGLYEKPFIMAIKNDEKNTVSAFLLKGGLSALYSTPEFGFLRNILMGGPSKVGIMLSGARYLDLPEMSMPMENIVVPHDFTLSTQFRMNQEGLVLPWLFITNKDDLRLGSLDKLMEIGLFSMTNEKVQIARDLLFEEINKPEVGVRSILYPFQEDFEQHEDKFNGFYAKPVYRVLGDNMKYNYVPAFSSGRVVPSFTQSREIVPSRFVVPHTFETVRHNPLVYPAYTPIVY